jgi:hypothetical protein
VLEPGPLDRPSAAIGARRIPSRLSCSRLAPLNTSASPRSLSPRSLLPAHSSSIASPSCAPVRAFNARADAAPIAQPVARLHAAPRVEDPFWPVSPARRLVRMPSRLHHTPRELSLTHLSSPEGPAQGEAGSSRDSLRPSSPCCARPHPYLYYSSSPLCCCSCRRSPRPSSGEYLSLRSRASILASSGTARQRVAMAP